MPRVYGDAVSIDGGEISLDIRIDGGEVGLDIRIDGGEIGAFTPLYPNAYAGATTVTPSEETQVLATAGLMVSDNITVDPIPSNYGLITWDGSKIIVS